LAPFQRLEAKYDSDDSDALITTNTIGNIPLTFYDSYPHIGYDINGKRIMRPDWEYCANKVLERKGKVKKVRKGEGEGEGEGEDTTRPPRQWPPEGQRSVMALYSTAGSKMG